MKKVIILYIIALFGFSNCNYENQKTLYITNCNCCDSINKFKTRIFFNDIGKKIGIYGVPFLYINYSSIDSIEIVDFVDFKFKYYNNEEVRGITILISRETNISQLNYIKKIIQNVVKSNYPNFKGFYIIDFHYNSNPNEDINIEYFQKPKK